MAVQTLAYSIEVNDRELRLATQRVAAFNAEVARSTVVGRGLDTQLRSIGRRTSQVGNFFIRNVTLPLVLAGAAAAKYASDFEKAQAKVEGLAGTTAAEVKRLRDAVFSLASKEATLGPNELEKAIFHLRSAGLTATQTIKALKPVSEAAVAGLGDIASVTTAVTSAMDSYGFKNLSAAHATDVLIETVKKGNVPVEQLSGSIGRVTSLAAAMGISFDQVGAAIATLTRQMPNANLAVTGFRAILTTLLRDQPQVEKVLNQIGASGGAVQESLKKVGVFPTLVALRQQISPIKQLGAAFDAHGKKTKGLIVDQKTLQAAYAGNGAAGAKLVASVGAQNTALAHLFPNVRALAAFLIITGKNAAYNANIFEELSASGRHVGEALKIAFGAFSRTDAGKLRAAISDLQVQATKTGPAFIRAGTSILRFGTSVLKFFENIGGPFKAVFKNIGLGVLLFGPIVALVGRATQAASFGVTMWGRWQVAATDAAFAAEGVNLAAARALIAQRKAVVQLESGFSGATGAVNQTTAAVDRLTGALNANGKAGALAGARGVRGQVAAASGGTALLAKASGNRKGAAVPPLPLTADAALIAARGSGRVQASGAAAQARIEQLSARRTRQLAAAEADYGAAVNAVTTAQERRNIALAGASTGEVRLATANLEEARTAQIAAAAELARAKNLKAAIFENQELIALTQRLQSVEASRAAAAAQGYGLSAAQQQKVVLGLQEQIALQQRVLAGQDVSRVQQARLAALVPVGGGFSSLAAREREMQAGVAASTAAAAASAGRAANISSDRWATAMQGIKSTSRAAFDFIGLIFITDLASKLVFSSHKTKVALTHDLFDFQKAGVASISAVVAAATFGFPLIVRSFSRIRSGVGVFEAIGISALSGRTKIGLLLASMLGLQAAGVHLETIFNAAFGILALKALQRLIPAGAGAAGALDSIGGAGAGAAGALGTLGISGVLAGNKVVTGADEGTAALAIEEAQALKTAAAVGSISAAGVLLPLGVRGLGGGARAGEEVAGGGLGSKLLSGIGLGALAKGGAGLFSGEGIATLARFAIGKVAIPALVATTIASLIPKHVLREVPLIGGALSFFGRDDEKKKPAVSLTDKRILGVTPEDVKNLSEIQKQALEPIPAKFRQAIVDLFKAHQDIAAQTLINQVEMRQETEQARRSIQLLDRAGQHSAANVLRAFLGGATKASKQFEALTGHIGDAILRAFDFSTDTLLSKFDATTSALEDKFDAKTTALEEKLKVIVKVPKLRESFTVSVSGKTPAERELDALDKIDQRRNFQRDTFDARRNLNEAVLIGDPAAVREAQRKVQDAEAEQKRFHLEQRAAAERAAADRALVAGKTRLDTRRAGEKTTLDTGRASLRRDLVASRAVEREVLEGALATQAKLVASGKESLATYFKNVKHLMKTHNITLARLGREGGKAYETQMAGYFHKLRVEIAHDMAAIQKKVTTTTAQLKKDARILAALSPALAAVFGIKPSAGGKAEAEALRAAGFVLSPVTQPGRGVQLDATNGHPLATNGPSPPPGIPTKAATKFFGIPTRPEILKWVRRIDQPLAEISRLVDLVPKQGHPSDTQYHKLLGAMNASERFFVRKNLRAEGFSRAATGMIVPGQGVGDTVPALLTPGEVVFNRRQQRRLGHMIGMPGAGPHALFSTVDRFADGGVAAKKPKRQDTDDHQFHPAVVRQQIRRIWEVVSASLPAGAQQPSVVFGDKAERRIRDNFGSGAYAVTEAQNARSGRLLRPGQRPIILTDDVAWGLQDGLPYAYHALTHEFAHEFQTKRVLQDRTLAEGGAEDFARALWTRVSGRFNLRGSFQVGPGYGGYARQVERLGRKWFTHDQFVPGAQVLGLDHDAPRKHAAGGIVQRFAGGGVVEKRRLLELARYGFLGASKRETERYAEEQAQYASRQPLQPRAGGHHRDTRPPYWTRPYYKGQKPYASGRGMVIYKRPSAPGGPSADDLIFEAELQGGLGSALQRAPKLSRSFQIGAAVLGGLIPGLSAAQDLKGGHKATALFDAAAFLPLFRGPKALLAGYHAGRDAEKGLKLLKASEAAQAAFRAPGPLAQGLKGARRGVGAAFTRLAGERGELAPFAKFRGTDTEALRARLEKLDADYERRLDVLAAAEGRPGDYKRVTAIQNLSAKKFARKGIHERTVKQQLRDVAEGKLQALMRSRPHDPTIQRLQAEHDEAVHLSRVLNARQDASFFGDEGGFFNPFAKFGTSRHGGSLVDKIFGSNSLIARGAGALSSAALRGGGGSRAAIASALGRPGGKLLNRLMGRRVHPGEALSRLTERLVTPLGFPASDPADIRGIPRAYFGRGNAEKVFVGNQFRGHVPRGFSGTFDELVASLHLPQRGPRGRSAFLRKIFGALKDERGELDFGATFRGPRSRPFVVRAAESGELPKGGEFLYHGSSRKGAYAALHNRKLLATQAERALGHAPPGAFFTDDPAAAAFRGDYILGVPRSLVERQLTPHKFGVFSSPKDVHLGPKRRDEAIQRALSQGEVHVFGEFQPEKALFPAESARFGRLNLREQIRALVGMNPQIAPSMNAIAKKLGLDFLDVRPALSPWRGQNNLSFNASLKVPQGGYTPEFEERLQKFASGVGRGFKQGSLSFGRPVSSSTMGSHVFPGLLWDARGKDAAAVQASFDKLGEGEVGFLPTNARQHFYVVNFGLPEQQFRDGLRETGVTGKRIFWQGSYVHDKKLAGLGGPGIGTFQDSLRGERGIASEIAKLTGGGGGRGRRQAAPELRRFDAVALAKDIRETTRGLGLRAPEDLAGPRLLPQVRAMISNIEQGWDLGWDWYLRHAILLQHMGGLTDADPVLLGRLSHYSQQQSPSLEVQHLAAVAKALQSGEPIPLRGVNQEKGVEKVKALLAAGARSKAPARPGKPGLAHQGAIKTYSYAANKVKAIGRDVYEQIYGDARYVALDLHHTRVQLPRQFARGIDSPGKAYHFLEQAFLKAGEHQGLDAEMMQAAWWVPAKAGNEIRLASLSGRGRAVPKGLTPDQYMERAADAGERGFKQAFGAKAYEALIRDYERHGLGRGLDFTFGRTKGFRSGGPVPGSGHQDTVPAMLTPGEVVLNRGQQRNLGGMLGLGSVSPKALFSAITSGLQRFAGGGVVDRKRLKLAEQYKSELARAGITPRFFATHTDSEVSAAADEHEHPFHGSSHGSFRKVITGAVNTAVAPLLAITTRSPLFHYAGPKFRQAGRDIGGFASSGYTFATATAAADYYDATGQHARAKKLQRKVIDPYLDAQVGAAITAPLAAGRHPLRDPFFTAVAFAPFLHGALRGRGAVAKFGARRGAGAGAAFARLASQRGEFSPFAKFGEGDRAALEAAAMQVEYGGAKITAAARKFGVAPRVLLKYMRSAAHAEARVRIHSNADVGGGLAATSASLTRGITDRLFGQAIGPRGERHPEDFTNLGGVFKPSAAKGVIGRVIGSTRPGAVRIGDEVEVRNSTGGITRGLLGSALGRSKGKEPYDFVTVRVSGNDLVPGTPDSGRLFPIRVPVKSMADVHAVRPGPRLPADLTPFLQHDVGGRVDLQDFRRIRQALKQGTIRSDTTFLGRTRGGLQKPVSSLRAPDFGLLFHNIPKFLWESGREVDDIRSAVRFVKRVELAIQNDQLGTAANMIQSRLASGRLGDLAPIVRRKLNEVEARIASGRKPESFFETNARGRGLAFEDLAHETGRVPDAGAVVLAVNNAVKAGNLARASHLLRAEIGSGRWDGLAPVLGKKLMEVEKLQKEAPHVSTRPGIAGLATGSGERIAHEARQFLDFMDVARAPIEHGLRHRLSPPIEQIAQRLGVRLDELLGEGGAANVRHSGSLGGGTWRKTLGDLRRLDFPLQAGDRVKVFGHGHGRYAGKEGIILSREGQGRMHPNEFAVRLDNTVGPPVILHRSSLAKTVRDDVRAVDQFIHGSDRFDVKKLEYFIKHASRNAGGGVIGGSGSGDTVPALLTPGEVVLNRGQQQNLTDMLGVGRVGARGLFGLISRGMQRFARGGIVQSFGPGGIVGNDTGGIVPPQHPVPVSIPGFSDFGGAIKKLIQALAKSALASENLGQNLSKAQEKKFENDQQEFVQGGRFVGAEGHRRFIASTAARRAQLFHEVDPASNISIQKLIASNPKLAALPRARKLALETRLAQLQAHPIQGGLITALPTGTTLGGKGRLNFGDTPLGGLGISPHRPTATLHTDTGSSGGGGGGGIGRGNLTIEHVEINVRGADNPRAIAREVRNELLRVGGRNSAQRGGRNPGTTVLGR